MLFFHNIKKYIKQKVCSTPDRHVGLHEKRAPYSAFYMRGSLTLEASLVMPLFLAAFVALIFFLQVIQQNLHIQKALYNQVLKISGYSYYLNDTKMSKEAQRLLEASYIKAAVIGELGEKYLNNSYIKNGSRGMNLNITGKPENGILDVALEYTMEVPFNLLKIKGFNMVSRARCHLWIGNEKNALTDDSEYVYMTPKGTVYHIYKDCTYIKSNILSCNSGEIIDKRNASGAKYYQCGACVPYMPTRKNVYYTTYGTRYHYSKTCYNLHSDVYMIQKKEAEKKYRLCKKCQTRSEQ